MQETKYQTRYPKWENKVDKSIDDFIIENFSRIENSNGYYKTIWHELRDQLFIRYSLFYSRKNDNKDKEVKEKRGYIQSRINFYKDREFSYLQSGVEKEFILKEHKMPYKHPDWNQFWKNYKKIHRNTYNNSKNEGVLKQLYKGTF